MIYSQPANREQNHSHLFLHKAKEAGYINRACARADDSSAKNSGRSSRGRLGRTTRFAILGRVIGVTTTKMLAGVVLLAVAGIALVRLRIGTTATINWSDVRQSIDGFGGSSADFLTNLTPAQADFFFTAGGIGLSILRTQIIPG